MLKYAQNSQEKALSYLAMGKQRSDKGDFVKSVDYLQIAFDQVKESDFVDTKLEVLSYLIPAYRRAGLIIQSDENFQLLKQLSKDQPAYTSKIYTIFTEAKMADIDQDFCKSAKLRKNFAKILQPTSDIPDLNYRFDFSIYNQLCYVQIKCGTIEDAKETMKIVEDLYNKIDKKAPIKLIEFYHMNKALLANIAGNKEESKKQFILATDIAITSENNIVTRDILTERINADLDTPEEHSRLYKIVNEIVMKQTTVTEKLVKKESENYINNIKERDSKMMLWIAVAGFLMILIFVGIILNKRKEKEIKKRFQDIIENLHKEKENEKNTLEKERNITVSETKEPLINEETEKQILKNLKSFEEKNKFLSKDLSTTTMASALKTTFYLQSLFYKEQ